jgi:excisionase family DNA binding protein
MADAFLPVREVAQSLQVSARTVRRWIRLGYLPALKIGNTVRISERDVARLPETHPHSPEPGMAAASDEVFESTWDNDEDAVYDNWRALYGVQEG